MCFCLLLAASFTYTVPSITNSYWRRCLVYLFHYDQRVWSSPLPLIWLPYCLVIKRPNNGPNGPSAQSPGPDFFGPAQNGPLGQRGGPHMRWVCTVSYSGTPSNSGTTGVLHPARAFLNQTKNGFEGQQFSLPLTSSAIEEWPPTTTFDESRWSMLSIATFPASEPRHCLCLSLDLDPQTLMLMVDHSVCKLCKGSKWWWWSVPSVIWGHYAVWDWETFFCKSRLVHPQLSGAGAATSSSDIGTVV